MKKLYLLLAILACCMCAQAQVYFWKDGHIIYASTSTCDIRFTKVPASNFQTVANVTELNNSLYHIFGSNRFYRNRLTCGFQGYNTDIEYNTKARSGAEYAIYAITPGNSDLSAVTSDDPWKCFARMVYHATMIIDGMMQYCDTTKDTYAYLLGEALFLRAFALSEMVKLWGDVPMTWKIENGSVIPTQPKQYRESAYDAIRADLKRAAQLMPWSDQIPTLRSMDTYRDPYMEVSSPEIYMEHNNRANNTGAPSKAAALALLARVDLAYAGYALRPIILGQPEAGYLVRLNVTDANKRTELYQEALEACAQIIVKEDGKLLPDYAQVFKNVCADETNYASSEIIWEIPFANGARGQYMQYNCPKSNKAMMGLKNYQSGSCNSVSAVVPTLYFDFENGDKRRDVTIAPFEWIYDNGSSFSSNTDKIQNAFQEVCTSCGEYFLYQKITNINQWYYGKCRIEWMSREKNGTDEGINAPVIRYADVILMFCEAVLGGITRNAPMNNTDVSAQAQFDKIRARAGLPPKQLTMENLMDERKFEFAGEALRKYDLIRWGIFRSSMENTHTRLTNLDQHTGEFASIGDTIYFKYRYVEDTYSYTPNIKGFVLDQITCNRPSNYNEANGWCKKCVYSSDEDRCLSDYYYILYDYSNPEYLESHQLWPIFTLDMDKYGYLWNDYNY